MESDAALSLKRRTVLTAVGAGIAGGRIATGAEATSTESRYVLRQGEDCVPIEPIRGRVSVEQFYEYQLPAERVSDENGAVVGDTAHYASAGTRDLQRSQTSIAFLYRGPEGLSLVVVHGSLGADDSGSVTFRLSGLPEDGEWAVKDDLYRNQETGETADTNYDRWRVDGTEHRIDWTWGSAGTDGGAFRELGEEFSVRIEPAFNGSAALDGRHYEGEITDWEFLSGSVDASERIALDLAEPIRIETGRCDGSERDEDSDESGGESGNADEDDRGEGNGSENGRGEGHEKGRGEGHEKHGEDDKTEEEGDEDDEDDEDERDD